MPTKDFLGTVWEFDCMGCAIADQTMLPPGGMILRTAHFCVHQDPLIPIPGFLVIASTHHIQSITEMGKKEYLEFAQLARAVHQAVKQVTQVAHLTLVQEERSRHFHLWFFPWTDEILRQYGQSSLDKIRPIMAAYKNKTLSQEEWAVLDQSIQAIKSRLT